MGALAIGKTVLLSIPPIVAAVFTWKHLTEAAAPFMDPIMDRCKAETEGTENPFLKFFDSFNCVIIPFFLEVVRKPEGIFIWANFSAIGASFGAFQAVEASRYGARIPLTWQPIFNAVYQVVGISVGVPLLWLPSYFAFGQPSTFTNRLNLKISWYRVVIIAVINLAYFGVALGPLFPWLKDEMVFKFIKFMVWAPVGAPLLMLLVPTFAASNGAAGKQAVILMHTLTAGVALATHIALVLYLCSEGLIYPKLVLLVVSHPGGKACLYFLLVDLAVFWASLVYQVLVEDGILPVLAVIAGTPVLGLGAPLSLYYAYRESKITAPDQAPKKVTKGKKNS